MGDAGFTVQDWRRMFGAHPSIVLLLDPTDHAVIAANAAAERFYGFATSGCRAFQPTDLSAPTGGQGHHVRSQHRLATGELRDVEVAGAPITVDGRELVNAVVHDVTDRQRTLQVLAAREAEALRRAEQLGMELDASNRRFEQLVEHASDPIIVFDSQQRVTYLSPAAAVFLGDDAPSARDIVARVSEQDRRLLRENWHTLLAEQGAPRHLVVQVTRADGRRRHLAVTMSDLRTLDSVAGIVVTARDLTDELTVRSRLEHQTTHDGLTGLANRDLLLDELRRFMTHGRGRTRAGALILLDLIGMAGINDRTGHRTGDYLLRAVGRRLEDAAGDLGIVARTSGDEFGILIESGEGEAAALASAHRYARLFDAPFETPGGGTVLLRARFGVASTTTSGGAPAAVLRDANLALSAAQASHTARIRVCDDALRREEERRLRLEYELSTPTITEQFLLAYQPLVHLETGAVSCMEALLLWEHPELGEISPAEFVPIAERNGAIVQIGAWVLRRACEQLAAWDEAGVDPKLQVAINVSARQLLDVELVPTLATTLAETGLAPERITLEITETALADHSDVTTATVQAMADVGVRIHIDDFGTGYSSFAQLARFPFHALKIDRSFVTPLGIEAGADPIIAALLAIAAAQGLEVIAEGVDAEIQAARLQELGCQLAQGYLWSRALGPDAVPAFLAGPRQPLAPAAVARPG